MTNEDVVRTFVVVGCAIAARSAWPRYGWGLPTLLYVIAVYSVYQVKL